MPIKTTNVPIKYVQVDGQVALKIIKHYQDEVGTSRNTGFVGDTIQGALLGLFVQDDRNREAVLEITNSYPFPRQASATDDVVNTVPAIDLGAYQMDMMKSLRQLNVDHYQVGFYQSASQGGSFLSKILLESQFAYQEAIVESVVLIYDPEGSGVEGVAGADSRVLSLRAFRLTAHALDSLRAEEFSVEGLQKHNVTFNSLFEELPVVLRNSHLTNILLVELSVPPLNAKSQLEERAKSATSGGGGTGPRWATASDEAGSGGLAPVASSLDTQQMHSQLRLLLGCVDEMAGETTKLNNYYRQHWKATWNRQAISQGTAAGARLDTTIPPAPNRLDALVCGAQIDTYCTQIEKQATSSLSKLLIAEGLQQQTAPKL